MANIKSQIKRNRQNEKRRVRNRTFRGAARTAVNLARTAFVENDPNTKEAVLKAISTLDRAAEQGVIHPNNASRRKGRLMKRLAAFIAAPPVVEEPKKKKAAAPKKAAAKKKEA
ncbi:MAG: 30S ribosomal protein S20 [Chloroflexi bacterium]|nr:30S ribosomal protein S20 [Chloroflexota bacterium]